MKLTFVLVSAPAVTRLMESAEDINGRYPQAVDLRLYDAAREMTPAQKESMAADITGSDLVFTDLMGSPPAVVRTVYQALEKCPGHLVPYGSGAREYLRLGEFTAGGAAEGQKPAISRETMQKMQGMAAKMGRFLPQKMKDMQNYGLIMRDFKSADRFNMTNLLLFLLREYGRRVDLPQPQNPREISGASLCDPAAMTFYDNIVSYRRGFPFSPGKPVVALLFYGHTYPNDTVPCIIKVKEALAPFANVLPIAASGNFAESAEKLQQFLLEETEAPVDLLINFMSFRLGAGPMGGDHRAGIDFLQKADAPCLHPFFLSRKTVREWQDSLQGCGPSEILISVMLPELDGCIETYPVGAMKVTAYSEQYGVRTEELVIIEERLQRLVSRVKRHLALRRKPNGRKKIAIVCYNYPPGEGSLLGGAFLDTFASVAAILKNLQREGYAVDALSREELMAVFTAGKAVNSGKYDGGWPGMIRYPRQEYEKLCGADEAYQEVVRHWGRPPGNIMADGNDFLIPGLTLGNIFIGLQPTRGIHEQAEKTYHDKTLPPHHQYLAFYQWIQHTFQADVVLHIGTHGTLEFLPGKECGISGACYPDKLLQDIPHLYLYYVGNPSEATVAKRRSYANLVGYQAPLFKQGELDDAYVGLLTLVDNYRQSLALAPQTSGDLLADILQKARKLNLPGDLADIECELYRMKTSFIPRGLHVFGSGFSEEEAKEYVKGLLRYRRGEQAALRELLAGSRGFDLEALYAQEEYAVLEALDEEAGALFEDYLQSGEAGNVRGLGKKYRQAALDKLAYGKKMLEAVRQNDEMAGLLRVLAGRYNPAKPAGDIYRQPEILPAGYNLYQFDPRLIPTSAAFERGQKICRTTLNMYYRENGSYPQSVALILWGLETSRTQGETFSQILAYLGVRMMPAANPWEFKFEIIPAAELGRPRIDVVVNICGFFRDMFPNLIESLDDIFHQLAKINEPAADNHYSANTRRNYLRLLAAGYPEEEAEELAQARIFGPAEGEYGTGITGIVETKRWEQETQIGGFFLERMQYVYSRRRRGEKITGLYQDNLSGVALVSQTRSNYEYEITDLDHYYEFFGGLAKSVEMLRGRQAEMYITDTTEEKIFSERVERSIARGARTRLLNPKWIEGLLEHDYHGVQAIAQRFENILGLAATTGGVEAWMYDELYERYVRDAGLRERLARNNPHAYMNILEQMMEYFIRDYWQASKEQIDSIKAVYLELEGNIEETV